LLALVALAVGCAQERPPINRVQAVALQKSFFLGPDLQDSADDPEFYMRGTVIDVGYGAAQDGLFTSTYAMPVSRIKWEITENQLNARLGYERVQGTDAKGATYDGLRKKASNDGQVVATYRITSHFDIKRAYNPTTGEAMNIIEENTTDRPWYQREYMRVDWSQNLSTDTYEFDTLSMMGIYGGIQYEPIPYAVTDERHPDAPHFDLQQGYFDVTAKAFAKPQQIDLSSLGWGIDKFPACWLPGEFAGGTAPYGNCNPVEITLRHSFKKVVDNDYEPVDWDGYRFQAFGIFTNEYYGYERNYGMVDEKWFRFGSRYNIWERSHSYLDLEKMQGEVPCNRYDTTVSPTADPLADPNRDTDGNGTVDECEEVTQRTGAGGSRCDVFKRKCTLPFRTRTQKTIPWYVNGDTGDNLFEATNWAVQEWDLAVKAAVQTTRLVECRRTGGGGDCDSQYPMWVGQQDDYDDAVRLARQVDACARERRYARGACDGVVGDAIAALASERSVNTDDLNLRAMAAISKAQPVIVLCHNPVIDGDHPVCGARGLAPRMGDLRYNTVLAIEKPQTPSAWGIMMDADDPVTGEKVASSINIWTHITDLAAQNLLDLVLYMNGELTTPQITNGDHVHNWVMAQRAGGAVAWPTMDNKEVMLRLGGTSELDQQAFERLAAAPMTPEVRAVLNAGKAKVRDTVAHAGVPSVNQAMVDTRMNLARGTPTEAKLINPAMLQLAGIPGNLPVTGQVLKMASPLGLNNPKILSQLRRMKENALAKRGACILREAPEASSLTGIADIIKKKFPAVDGETAEDKHTRHLAMFRYLQRRYHYAVIAHEMGHSVGHRHNFVSSAGALHYRPQYWQLRTRNGAVTSECTSPKTWQPNAAKTCVGPRFFDPVTQEEQDQLIWMWMQSSAMDYPGDVSQDLLGLGIWDFATTRAIYGDTSAVYSAPEIRAGTALGVGVTEATDTFGGLLGLQYSIGTREGSENFHYAQLQKNYQVIQNCYAVNPEQPSWWREDVDGIWDPVMDGHFVAVNGEFKKCRQMPVDYVAWTDLRPATADEGEYTSLGFDLPGPTVDPSGRLRVPYHFATDHWADLGNVSVFRHDNGADPYEQAMFIITTMENRHIFDNFRRNRTTFNPRSSADRAFSRYNEKLANLAGSMAFLASLYRNVAINDRVEFKTIWPVIASLWARQNIIAASVSFDHLTRQISRPQQGDHYYRTGLTRDDVLRSVWDADGSEGPTAVIIPNGATGFLRDVGFGGAPLENALATNNGDYSVDYTVNAGSYYNKINAIIHMSLSEDRFISQSRGDFYDARWRASGLADVFPDGYRRIIGNLLVNDRRLLASHLVADPQTNAPNKPRVDGEGYPVRPLGWTSWWPSQGPVVCFATNGRNTCTPPDGMAVGFDPENVTYAQTAKVDPQIGWEVQKFTIAWALSYITANQKTDWVDMMKIYRLGANSNPEIPAVSRIEWEDPISGEVYYARRIGKECLFHDPSTCPADFYVEKGIAARVLEYANNLTAKGYKNTGRNASGRVLVVRHPDGTPVVLSDAAIRTVTPDGYYGPPREDCDRNVNPSCTPLTIDDNRWATELKDYKTVPDYLWEVLWRYQLGSPHQLGLYP
jgi:hypothetical protein